MENDINFWRILWRFMKVCHILLRWFKCFHHQNQQSWFRLPWIRNPLRCYHLQVKIIRFSRCEVSKVFPRSLQTRQIKCTFRWDLRDWKLPVLFCDLGKCKASCFTTLPPQFVSNIVVAVRAWQVIPRWKIYRTLGSHKFLEVPLSSKWPRTPFLPSLNL